MNDTIGFDDLKIEYRSIGDPTLSDTTCRGMVRAVYRLRTVPIATPVLRSSPVS